MSKTDKVVKIEQIGSPIRRQHTQRETLIGLGHVQSGMPFGWDGRNPTLEAQAKNSVATGAM